LQPVVGKVGERATAAMSWGILLLAMVSAGLPTLAYLALVWWLDRYEKEPAHLLAVTFLWGALPAALLVATLDLALDWPLRTLGEPVEAWRRAGLLTPVIEELVKGAALVSVARWYRHEFNGVLDGIIYGAFVGLGFALTENLLSFAAAFGNEGLQPGLVLVTLRAGLFGLNHPLFSALFGAGLGWVRYHGGRWTRPLVAGLGLAAAIGLHLLHNALAAGPAAGGWALALVADWSGLALIATLIALAWAHERRWLVEGLGEEMHAGTLSREEFAIAISHRRRAAAEWRAFRQSGWRGYRALARHYQALTDLAFARFHLRWQDGAAPDQATLNRLRARTRRGRLALAASRLSAAATAPGTRQPPEG
jgi:RsiW-degrading membrane proteinase PrsW (M82 family)